MISEWGAPPSATGWFKKYKVVHLPLWFQNGVCLPLLQQGGSKKYKVAHLPLWFQNGVWPPLPPPFIGQTQTQKKFFTMIILLPNNNNNNNNNMKFDHYLTCRLPPQVKMRNRSKFAMRGGNRGTKPHDGAALWMVFIVHGYCICDPGLLRTVCFKAMKALGKLRRENLYPVAHKIIDHIHALYIFCKKNF